MTPEREKYLASISKEERAIRLELNVQKNRLKYLKELIKYPIHMNDKRTMLRLMQDTRFVIKNLKKQLPAPRKEYQNEYLDYCLCPICRWYANHERDYCPKCGHKLR